MELAIKKLQDAEVVLMNRIKRMKDGKPKYEASENLRDIRQAIDTLQMIHTGKATIVSNAKSPVY